MAAATRPYWTGFLKLSLITIGVRLYSATTDKEQKGRYVTVEPADLEQLRLDTTDTIDITMRERIVAIRPYGAGLLVNVLRFPAEVRAADQFFAGIGDQPVDKDELALMQQIIARRTRKFEPGKFVDHYQAALKDLIEEKLAGKLPARPPERKPAQVINLMDALKRSLTEESANKTGAASRGVAQKTRSAAPAKARRKSRSTSASKAQPSLLLPVTGGRQRSSAETPAEASKRRRKA